MADGSGKNGATQDKANEEKDETGKGAAGDQSDKDEDDEDDDDGEPAPTVESLKTGLDSALRALRTERRARRELTAELKKLQGGKNDDAKKDGGDDKVNQQIEKLETELKQRDAVAALLDTPDFNGGAAAARRAVKTFSSLDAADLESEIEAYKEDNPAMFKKKKRLETPNGTPRGSGKGPNDDDKPDGLSAASRKMLGMTR